MSETVNIPKRELVDINSLRVDGDNPNRMTDKQKDALKKSILRWGFIVPIITNKDLLVADGEQKLIVAKDLGMPKVPVIRLPVTDIDRRLLRQVLNKLKGEHDVLGDALEFNKIIMAGQEEDIKQLLGLRQSEIESYLSILLDVKEETYIPPPYDTVKTDIVRGDLFSLGPHRLMCGDATEDLSVLMDKPANMVFTDPPYNVNYGISKNPRHKIRSIKGDHQSVEAWDKFCEVLGQNLVKHNEGAVYVCHGSGADGQRLSWILSKTHHWSATIVWYKNRIVLTPAHYQRQYEPLFYGWARGRKVFFVNKRNLSEVWNIDRPSRNKYHPTMKPLALCRRAIINSSLTGEIVADWFGGSGSTLIACEQTTRICYMMELDPKYCQIIINRWKFYSKGVAVKIET